VARHIYVVIHPEDQLKTTGVGVDFFTKEFGYWRRQTDEERLEKFKQWVDKTKYDLSVLWINGEKEHRVYKKGFTIRDQIDTLIEEIAGDGNDDTEIDFRQIIDHKNLKFKDPYQTARDHRRTFRHNLNSKWLKTEDTNIWSQTLASDLAGTNKEDVEYLILPSFKDGIYKAGFDPERAKRE